MINTQLLTENVKERLVSALDRLGGTGGFIVKTVRASWSQAAVESAAPKIDLVAEILAAMMKQCEDETVYPLIAEAREVVVPKVVDLPGGRAGGEVFASALYGAAASFDKARIILTPTQLTYLQCYCWDALTIDRGEHIESNDTIKPIGTFANIPLYIDQYGGESAAALVLKQDGWFHYLFDRLFAASTSIDENTKEPVVTFQTDVMLFPNRKNIKAIEFKGIDVI